MTVRRNPFPYPEAKTPTDLEPYVCGALEAFGAERCMYGSDYSLPARGAV